MVALKTAEAERFVVRPDPTKPVVLVYGADAGLVSERVEALIAKSVDDPADPFQLARLDGDALARDPGRLSEEANTIPLFGGRRAVWVKAGAQNFAPAVEALLASLPENTRVVIQAGDLRRTAPLRAVCEKAKAAVALPCYPDGERDLSRLIDGEMRNHGLSISPQARAALLPLLGGDRLASRHEIEKLALFARGKGQVEVEDVNEVVADASALALDAVMDAAFAGEPGWRRNWRKCARRAPPPARSCQLRCAKSFSCTERDLPSSGECRPATQLPRCNLSCISAVARRSKRR